MKAQTTEGVWVEKKWLEGLVERAEKVATQNTVAYDVNSIMHLLGYISSIKGKI
jgi:hypothetical protein